MLMFATEFPVKAEGGAAQFVACFRKWILGSPHSSLTEEDFAGSSNPTGVWNLEKGIQKLSMLHTNKSDDISVAFRNQIEDAGLEWNTEVVFSKNTEDNWVGVRTFCEAIQSARSLPIAKKPIIVSTLLKSLNGGQDGGLTVEDRPHHLTGDDIAFASQVILGKAGCRLPVVYLSSAFDGAQAIDPNALANDLAGIAHVIVEPNRAFSIRLKIEVNSENVYGGAVGVYWPDGGGRRSYFIARDFTRRGEMKAAILSEIRLALVNKRPNQRCMWASVQEASAQQEIAALKGAESNEIRRYVDAFDIELNAARSKLESAENEIQRLKSEIRRFEARAPVGAAPALATGEEQNYYQGEISALICEILTNHRESTLDGSRRRHVIDAITQHNQFNPSIESKRREIRKVLNGYTSMTAKIRKDLEGLGFAISEEGKHYKLLYQNDNRYNFSLAKSGSDHRGGANMATDICKKIF